MDKENVTVSIIIPTYNSAKTIKRCINSVLEQDYDNIEVVVVDDGSIDDTISVASKMKDPRIKMFKLAHNGVSAARNFGLSRCTGKYVMFLDSDDTISPDAVSVLVNRMEKDKEIDIVKFGFQVIDNKGYNKHETPGELCRVFDTRNKDDKEMLIDSFFRNEKTIPCFSVTLLIRKNFLDENDLRFDESLYMMEDAVFYLNMFNKDAKINFIKDALYNCYLNNNSATRSIKNNIRTASGAIKSCTVILGTIGYDSIVTKKYFKIIFGYIAKSLYIEHRFDEVMFCDDFVKIAVNADMSGEKMWWKNAKRAVARKNRFLLVSVAYLHAIKNKLRGQI